MMRTAGTHHIMHDERVSKTPRRADGIWDQDTKLNFSNVRGT